jgi:hypothetical protein
MSDYDQERDNGGPDPNKREVIVGAIIFFIAILSVASLVIWGTFF